MFFHVHSISEENFWRNYFYRVSLLRQSHELNAMASQAESNPTQNLTSTGSIDQTQGKVGFLPFTTSEQASYLHQYISCS